MQSTHRIEPGSKVRLRKIPTASTGRFRDSEAAADALEDHRHQLTKLQEVLYAGAEHAVLIVLQGMDTAGKDGTISHIFSGINPQGCDVTPFKVPTPLEAKHDFLWRAHAAVPPLGKIGIFNRSHYEDVLSPLVHGLISEKTAHRHMEQILSFEQMLVQNNVTILKFFLHISAEQQEQRLQERIDTPDKHWKLSAGDFAERKFWPQYQAAYQNVIERTSVKSAPWFVIPSDHKWYRNVAISGVLVDTLKGLKLQYPKPTVDPSTLKLTPV